MDYLTIKQESLFHIFDAAEVLRIIDSSVTVENSRAAHSGQMDDQKVIFKLADGTTIGEIEMRNDSDVHYRQVKFWMDREKTIHLLKEAIIPPKRKSDRIIAYGKAASKFKL